MILTIHLQLHQKQTHFGLASPFWKNLEVEAQNQSLSSGNDTFDNMHITGQEDCRWVLSDPVRAKKILQDGIV